MKTRNCAICHLEPVWKGNFNGLVMLCFITKNFSNWKKYSQIGKNMVQKNEVGATTFIEL